MGRGGGAHAQDGRRIVSGSGDKSVRVWDAETGAELLQLQGHTGEVTSVVVSAGAPRVAKEERGRGWAGAAGTDRDLKGAQDGRRIVSGSEDRSVRVWDAETGAELLHLQSHTGEVTSVAVSADRDLEACGRDERRIVSGSGDKSVRVWDAETGAELLQLQGHTDSVYSVAVSAVRRAGSQC
eukprot:tig00020710_g13290.t1